MKRNCLLLIGIFLLAGMKTGRAQNVAIEEGPFANDWQCLTNGFATNAGLLNWTNVSIVISNPVPQPDLIISPAFAPGKIRRDITFNYHTDRDHSETNSLLYLAGPLQFSPLIPS